MKNTFKLFLALFMVVFAINVSMAQPDPTYTLTAENFQIISVNNPDDAVTFEIRIRHTNLGVSQPFKYATGQFFFTFNRNIFPNPPVIFPDDVGDSSKYSYKLLGTDANFAAQFYLPRNPSFANTTNEPPIPADQGLLRLASNSAVGCNFPFALIISAAPGGTLIAKMRIWSVQGTFNMENLNMAFRNPNNATDNVTRINYYRALPAPCTNMEITTPATHSVIDNTGTLPVELTNFTSVISRNNVTLNWSTATETNNQGFDVERKLTSETDWVKAGTVEGKGTTEEQTNYTFTERANTGTYNYRLKQIDLNGNFEYFTLSNEVIVGVPSEYKISQNYPNPFNPTTKIDYDLPYDGKVSILLYDISGREVANLVNEVKTAGYHTIQFNGANLSSGMYFYRIIAQGNNNNFTQTKKMVLIK